MKVLRQANILFRKAQDAFLSLTQKLETNQDVVPTEYSISGAVFHHLCFLLDSPVCSLLLQCCFM